MSTVSEKNEQPCTIAGVSHSAYPTLKSESEYVVNDGYMNYKIKVTTEVGKNFGSQNSCAVDSWPIVHCG